MQNFIETKFGSKQVLHEGAWKCDWYIFFTTSTDLKLFLLHFCNKWPILDQQNRNLFYFQPESTEKRKSCTRRSR